MRLFENIIHVIWDGPFPIEDLHKFDNEDQDYGIYQIYGPHPSYGRNVLLYIGKANQQTFKTRIKQHDWETWEYDEGKVSFYIGRMSGEENANLKSWEKQIDLAEKLLIISHKPAFNSSGIKELSKKTDKMLRDVHVLNWGNYGDLLPECSGGRWTDKYVGDFEYYKLK